VLSRPFAVHSAGALASWPRLVLAGWTLDLAALKSLLPGWVSVKTERGPRLHPDGDRAVALNRQPSILTLSSRLARLCRWLAGVIGLLTLCEYAFVGIPALTNGCSASQPAGGHLPSGPHAPDTRCVSCCWRRDWRTPAARARRGDVGRSAILGSLVTTVSVAAMLSYFIRPLRNHGGGADDDGVPDRGRVAILGVRWY